MQRGAPVDRQHVAQRSAGFRLAVGERQAGVDEAHRVVQQGPGRFDLIQHLEKNLQDIFGLICRIVSIRIRVRDARRRPQQPFVGVGDPIDAPEIIFPGRLGQVAPAPL